MRIAITGATGFVGSHALQTLLAHADDEIIVAGRTKPSPHPRVTFVKTNLLDGGDHDWLATHRPTHLLHLAWYAKHGRFWESPLNQDWREATIRLVRAFCDQGGRKVIVAGTCAEYDWEVEDKCRESETLLRPSTRYGMEKSRTCGQVQKICADSGVTFTWGRIFYPFGPGEASTRLIPSVVEVFLQRRAPFPIYFNHQRDLMPVEDVADAFVYLLYHNGAGIFNICSGVPTRLERLIVQIGDAIKRNPQPLLTVESGKDNGPQYLVGDNRALLDAGWRPRYDPMERLRGYVCMLAQEMNQ